jgi:predicted nucleotidyltransferase
MSITTSGPDIVLWCASGHVCRAMSRAMLQHMTTQYVAELTATYPGIREVWLLGSRANGTATEASDWDYLVFLDDDRIFNALCRDLRSPALRGLVGKS